MNEKELKQIKNDIIKLQKKVSRSHKAAKQYLIELGVLNSKGILKREFRIAKQTT